LVAGVAPDGAVGKAGRAADVRVGDGGRVAVGVAGLLATFGTADFAGIVGFGPGVFDADR
jgi:hypothetical protein